MTTTLVVLLMTTLARALLELSVRPRRPRSSMSPIAEDPR